MTRLSTYPLLFLSQLSSLSAIETSEGWFRDGKRVLSADEAVVATAGGEAEGATSPTTIAAVPLQRSLSNAPLHHHERKHMNVNGAVKDGPTPRIIGGDEADVGRYPYIVSLQDNVGHFCGGSLIAPDVVLTAAHCSGTNYGNVRIVVGSHTTTPQGSNADIVSIQKLYVHPRYNENSSENDYAVIFLKRPTTSNVPFVRLNREEMMPTNGDVLTAIGWGDTNTDDMLFAPSEELREVDVDYIPNGECEESEGCIGDWCESYNGLIFGAMLCASSPGKDGCQGDSGGPIIFAGREAEDDVQVGLASWGIGCASPSFPGVYSRISSEYKWIRNKVCRRSRDPPSHFNCSVDEKNLAMRFVNKAMKKKNQKKLSWIRIRRSLS
eukprot:g3497.t1 g3497   contig12:2188440-2189856(-)